MAKHLRQTRRRTLLNRNRRKDMKESIRTVMDAARLGDSDTVKASLPQAQKAIDKAAKHGIIHANTAGRRKSRLVGRVRRMLGEQ
ncbi:MAG: 30S ribosomal protein S20 [candidate division WS1 bacterium]|jgi:small subunit ribosomal protein S20|nr:30S ribosomal protein S20 [candidate division WS1 bacterium]